MTTREQLGLNANWIPMDSSKSGGSDEFLVKKVNQLEEKVTELKELEYKPISKEIVGGTYSPMLKLEPDYTNHRVKIFLKDVSNNVQVRFKVNTNAYWTVVTVDKPYTISLAEEYNPLLVKYGLRKMVLDVILKNVQVKGFESLPVQIEATGYDGFKRKEFNSNGEVNLIYKSEYINIVNRLKSKKIYDESNGDSLNLDDIITPLSERNAFIVDVTSEKVKCSVFVLEEDSIYILGTKITYAPVLHLLKTWKEGLELRCEEDTIPWRDAAEQAKVKLQPIRVENSGFNASKYGYYGDKEGFPIYVFAPKLYGCLSYIYKTDCSEWIGYFFDHFSAAFIKNGKVVPRTQGDVFKLATDPRGVYNYTNNVVSVDNKTLYYNSYSNLKDLDLSRDTYRAALRSYSVRQHAGIVESDFNNGSTYEIWSYIPQVLGDSSITTSIQMLSSIINKDTGEFNRDDTRYEKWRDNHCVLHQTLAKVGDRVQVSNSEITTLDVFFKNFIAKSEEWKTKNPDKVETQGIKGDYTRKFIWNGIYDYL